MPSLFQHGACKDVVGVKLDGANRVLECCLGKRACAALFRGGRTCHGRHAAQDCVHTKRHAKLDIREEGGSEVSATPPSAIPFAVLEGKAQRKQPGASVASAGLRREGAGVLAQ